MKRVKEYLEKHPRHKNKIQYELLEAGINFYHILSLVWDVTTRKHTREFLIWKAQETIEIMVNAMPDNFSIEDLDKRIKDEFEVLRTDCKDDPRVIYELLGAEIDNSPNKEIAFTFDFKIAIMIYLLEIVEKISLSEIMAKYC